MVNKDELSKKYMDLKIKPLGSKKDSNLISNTDLEEIDEYLETKPKDDAIKEDRKTKQKGAKKDDHYGNPVDHHEATDEYMDGNNSITKSGSTSTSPKPSLSNARKLKLYKAERKLKQITKTLAAQTLAA